MSNIEYEITDTNHDNMVIFNIIKDGAKLTLAEHIYSDGTFERTDSNIKINQKQECIDFLGDDWDDIVYEILDRIEEENNLSWME